MARDFITITLSEKEGPQLLNTAIASLRQALRDIQRVQGQMVHSNDGSVWTDLESKFGIPAGLGDDVFALVNGTLQVLDGTISGYAKELMDRVGLA